MSRLDRLASLEKPRRSEATPKVLSRVCVSRVSALPAALPIPPSYSAPPCGSRDPRATRDEFGMFVVETNGNSQFHRILHSERSSSRVLDESRESRDSRTRGATRRGARESRSDFTRQVKDNPIKGGRMFLLRTFQDVAGRGSSTWETRRWGPRPRTARRPRRPRSGRYSLG